MQHVDSIHRPLIIGERYIVPCIIKESDMEYMDEQDLFLGKNYNRSSFKKMYITPVINHPHNDVENGQHYIHYHADFRFIKYERIAGMQTIKRKHSVHIFCEDIRPTTKLHGKIQHIVLPVVNAEFGAVTPVEAIAKSNLKHDCIYKGKCPHRGYPLDQVEEINGVITCPLHGLQFDSITHKIIHHIKQLS